jgi:hypothetical protein
VSSGEADPIVNCQTMNCFEGRGEGCNARDQMWSLIRLMLTVKRVWYGDAARGRGVCIGSVGRVSWLV